MKQSIKDELTAHAIEIMHERGLKCTTEDLHDMLFNEDYYIIGYYQASEWLKEHEIGEFEAIELLKELQREHFGAVEELEYNSESVVNQLVYFWGYEIIDDMPIVA